MSEPYLNAADYGTTLDDVTMQAALDACHAKGGGAVVVPGGTSWTFTDTVIGYANTRLILDEGSYQTCDASGLPLYYWYDPTVDAPAGYTGRSNITVEGGGVLDMRAQDNTVAHNCMTFLHGQDITVRDITIKNVSSFHAIEPHACKNVYLENVKLTGWENHSGAGNDFREAVQVDGNNYTGDDGTPVQYLTMYKCYMGPSDECGAYPCLVGSHTTPASQFHRWIKVDACDAAGALTYGVHSLSWSDSELVGNTITGGPGHGIVLESNVDMDGTRVKVNGNTVTYMDGNGIRFDSVNSDVYTNCDVQANTVMNTGSNGILLQRMNRGVVAGNVIRSTTANYGIQVGNGSSHPVNDVVVTGNHVTDTASASYRVNQAQGCVIVGNYGDHGMSVGGTNTGTKYTWGGGTTAPGDNLL